MKVKSIVGEKDKETLRVTIVGNPNAGKTTLFNALTRSNLRTGNFHGVTCAPAEKTVGKVTYVDSPGLYALKGFSMEEASAAAEIKSADIILNVVDATTLENSLNLTKGIISLGKPVIVYLTKTDRLKKQGGWSDKKLLSEILGVPVFDGSIKELKNNINNGINFNVPRVKRELNTAYSGGNLQISRADKLFYNRFFASAFFVCTIALMFFLAFHPLMPGALLKGLTEDLICEKLAFLLTSHMRSEAVISLLKDGILGGAGGVLSFIPQLAILYLFLTLLDESGITSALSFACDGLFEKVNLSGRAAFSLITGFGCTAAAIMTTRGYSGESAQKRTIAVLPYIPCGAKLPVFLTFLSPVFEDPFPVITSLYFAGVLLSLVFAYFIKGKGDTMFSEVTPITLPQLKQVANKLYFYLKGFIIKVAIIVTVFCVVSWFFSHFSIKFEYVSEDKSMLANLSNILLPVFYPMGISDWRLAYAVFCGFIAKENVAATVGMLMPDGTGLDLASSLAISVFILLAPACVSAFSAQTKEAGLKFTIKCYAVQTVIALILSFTVHLLFSL